MKKKGKNSGGVKSRVRVRNIGGAYVITVGGTAKVVSSDVKEVNKKARKLRIKLGRVHPERGGIPVPPARR